jgi:hypothetical protein
MPLSDYWDSDLATVFNVIQGRRDAEEGRERGEWERARWLAGVFLQPHMSKGRTLKAQDLAVFPWEREEKPVAVPGARRGNDRELFNRWDDEMKKQWQM